MRYKRFRIKLLFTMVMFAIIVSSTIAFVNFSALKSQATEDYEDKLGHIEQMVANSLQSIEKAYYLFDQETAENMHDHSNRLLEKYQENPDFSSWNFDELKAELGMDVYILNEDNVITHSSFEDDIGMDFNVCCVGLASMLDDYREKGIFHHDGLDIEQHTGNLRKYSYMGTPDGKHIIQLGANLSDGEILNSFNFLDVADQLVEQNESLSAIHVLNFGGLAYGLKREESGLEGERRETFDAVLSSQKTQEVKVDGLMYRYVPYQSDYDPGTSENKVIELVLDDSILTSLLDSQRNTFLWQMAGIVAVSILVAVLISRWVALPIHLAFHDSLTKLKNRASFEEVLNQPLQNDVPYAFLMIDLDYFKLVNDSLGHEHGDRLLGEVAQSIKQNIPGKATAYRYGGDEFIVIIKDSNRNEAIEVSNNLLESFEKVFWKIEGLRSLQLSASIGISVSPEHGTDAKSLYRSADVALYHSKDKGKNQWGFYQDEEVF